MQLVHNLPPHRATAPPADHPAASHPPQQPQATPDDASHNRSRTRPQRPSRPTELTTTAPPTLHPTTLAAHLPPLSEADSQPSSDEDAPAAPDHPPEHHAFPLALHAAINALPEFAALDLTAHAGGWQHSPEPPAPPQPHRDANILLPQPPQSTTAHITTLLPHPPPPLLEARTAASHQHPSLADLLIWHTPDAGWTAHGPHGPPLHHLPLDPPINLPDAGTYIGPL